MDLGSFLDFLNSRARAANIKPRISHKYDGVFHGFAIGLPNRFFDFATFVSLKQIWQSNLNYFYSFIYFVFSKSELQITIFHLIRVFLAHSR